MTSGWDDIVALAIGGSVGPALLGTALVATRLFAMARVLPFLGGKDAPAALHACLALALGACIGPSVGVDTVPAAPAVAVLALKEVLVGWTIGWIASLPFRAAEQAGVLADLARGSPLGSTPGVLPGAQPSSPSGNLLLVASAAVFFAGPSHRAFWRGVQASFVAIPVVPASGPPLGNWDKMVEGAIGASAGLITAAVMIAFPVLLAVLIADLAVGAASRFVPGWSGTFSAMPLRSLAGLAALAIALAAMLPALSSYLLGSMTALGSL